MADSANIIGKVAVLQGHAHIQHPDGSRVELKIGDPVHEGDVVVTDDGAVVELAFNDGHSYVIQQNETLAMDASVFNTQAVDAHAAALTAQAGQLDGLNAVIASGGSLDDLFDSAAAGITAGGDANSGHSFVQLLRIVESVDPGSFSLAGGANLTTVAPVTETLFGANAIPTLTISPLPVINGEAAHSGRLVPITGTVSTNVPVGGIVTISVDGHSYTGIVLRGGTYVVEVPASVLAGAAADSITASVSIPNSTGGVATTSATQSYGVELSAPPVHVTINAIPTVNAAMAAGTNTVAVTGTVSGNVPIGNTVTLTVDGHTYTGTVQAGGTYSIAVPGTILANASTDSIHASISSTDAAGNTATASADSPYSVELAAPAISISINPIPTVNGAEASSSNPVNVTGKVSDNVPVGDTVTLTIAGHIYTGTVQVGGTYSIGIPGNVLASAPLDSIHASLSSTDAAGNTATASADQPYAVELVAAPISISIHPISTINGVDGASPAPVAVTGNVSTNVPVGDIVTLSVDGHSYTGVVQSGGTYSVGVPGNVLANAALDSIHASVSATDAAGNTASASADQSYNVNLVGPVISIGINPIPTINGAEAASSNLINVTGSVSNNVPVGDTVTLTIDGHSYTGVVQSGGTYSVGVPGNVLANAAADSIQTAVSVTDPAGNSVTAVANQTYTVELAAPAITIGINTIPTVNSADAASSNPINVTGTVSSNVPVGDKVTLTVDGQPYTGFVLANHTYS
ncbi:hypothetical protein AAKU67_001411, partial [Oxalobacteraceae bacterium GrIS 2.11]